MILDVLPPECSPMVVSPPELTPETRTRFIAVLRALGDPTRLEVYRLIAAQSGPLCVCDIVERFNLTQPTISHHLKVLREAGLLTVSRRGTWAYYVADARGLAVFNILPDVSVSGEVSVIR